MCLQLLPPCYMQTWLAWIAPTYTPDAGMVLTCW